MAAGEEFLIRIRTQFESAGINEIAAQARQALAQIASIPAGPQRTEAAYGVRMAAETRLATLRQQALQGVDPNSTQYAAIRAQFTKAGQNLSQVFNQMANGLKIDAGKLKNIPKQMQGEMQQVLAEWNKLHPATRAAVGRAIAAANDQVGNIQTLRSGLQRNADVGLGVRPPLVDPRGRPLTPDQDRGAQQKADREYEQEQALAARLKKESNARIQQMIAADANYMDAQTALAAAQRSRAIREQAAAIGVADVTNRADLDLQAETAVRQKIRADLEYAAQTRAQTDRQSVLGRQLASAEAERRAATRALAHVQHMEARAEVTRAIQNREGTYFQRLQARFAYRGQNRLPDEYQRLGQFVGSRALVTGGFALAGTALYGSVRLIGEMVRESEELEKILNQVEAQLTAIGPAAQSSFGLAKEGILDIARDTGAQADEVASVFFQFRGAFAEVGDNFGDTPEALRQTEQAMKIVAVTGLDLKEVLDSLTAVSRTFGTDVAAISDQALGLQERFGVLARETITFVADLAPIANEIGMTLEDTAALGAVAQQVSGRSGSALAEGFGRILPAISEVRNEILSLYNLPQLQGQRNKILESFATGDTGQVFQQLVRDYQSLSRTQQQFVINTLGGRREAQVLIPVLQNASKLTREWDRNLAGLNEDTGKTDDYFVKLQETLSNTKDRFVEVFKQIGEAIYSSGIAEAFADLIDFSGGIVGIIASVANAFGSFNQALAGIPARLLLFMGLMRALRPLMTGLREASMGAARANQVEAASQQQVAAAATQASAATNMAATADVNEANTSRMNAAANTQQAMAQGSQFGPSLLGRDGYPAGTPTRGVRNLLFGGGRFIGRGMPVAEGLMGTIRSAVPVFLAFEAMNRFFADAAKEAQEASDTAARARDVLDKAASGQGAGGESYEEALARLQKEADELRGGAEKALRSDNPFAKGANWVGGLFGNESAARAAAGQPEDFEIIEQQIAARQSEIYADIITQAMNANQERLLEAVRNANLSVLNEVVQEGFSEGLINIFGDEGAGMGGPDEWKGLEEDLKNGLIDRAEITQENVAKLIELAAGGDQAAAEALRLISEFVQNNPELQGLINQGEVDQAIADAGGQGNFTLQNLDAVRQQYEANAIGVGAYIRELKAERQNLLDFINTSRRLGQPIDAEDVAALAKIDQDISTAYNTYYESTRNALEVYRDVIGVGSAAQQLETGGDMQGQVLDRQIGLLTLQIRPGAGLSLADRLNQVGPMIDLLQERFTRELEAIEDPVARANRAMEGFELPPVLQELFVAGQISADPVISGFATTFSEVAGVAIDTFYDDLAQGIVETSMTSREIILDIIDEQIAKLIRTFSSSGFVGMLTGAGAFFSSLAKLYALRADVASTAVGDPVELGGTGYQSEEQQQRDMEEAARAEEERLRRLEQLAQARTALAVAYANGDPVRIAQINLEAARAAKARATDELSQIQAEAQYIEAMNALNDAYADVTAARLDLYKTQVGRDPVRAAQVSVQIAAQAVQTAKGEAARMRAQGQLLEAQRDMQDALIDIVRAQSEQITAVAEASGNMIEAANEQYALAVYNLQQILADPNSGEAERIRAETEVIRAAAAKRDAEYNDRLGTIDFLLDMERISIGQAIEMLQSLMQIPDLTQEQLRTIQRRIKSLRDEASQDFQFNLPSVIDLPTLYTARRLNQSAAQGMGYNDNRVITVSVNAETNASAEDIAAAVTAAIGDPLRSGTIPKRY